MLSSSSVKLENPLKIFLDATALYSGGAITHLRALLSQPDHPDIRLLIAPQLWNELGISDQIDVNFVADDIKSPYRREIWRRRHLRRVVEDSGAQIYFDPGGHVPDIPIPCVTMIQNMLPFDGRLGTWYGSNLYQGVRLRLLRHRIMRSVARAHGVIFLSNWSKRVVTEFLGWSLPPLSCVIPHGSSAASIDSVSWRESPWVMCISDIEPYKHQVEVCRAYDICLRKGLSLGPLELIGTNPNRSYFSSVQRQIERSCGDIIYSGWLNYKDIDRAYHRSDILIFASSVECCPNILLEALSKGKPILCSREQPMPEFAGEGAIYMDPRDPLSIAEGLEKILTMDEKARMDLRARARSQARKFSWQTTASETWQFLWRVYRQSMGAGPDISVINSPQPALAGHE